MASDKLGPVYKDIPCYDNGVWTSVSYETREDFKDDLEANYFKEPGEYELDETIKVWQEPGNFFRKHGYFCKFMDGTRDFMDYWDDQKLKSRKGCFFWNNGKKWYLPRDYYFWINFMQIPDKVKKEDDFTDIWDSQMHMALYEYIGELNYEHGVVLKKRQFGSSLYHAAKLLNILWFEQSPILKIGASLSAYITGVTGTWKILQAYRIFLNKHTAWYRPMNPGGVGEWQQKIEYVEKGRKTEKGRKGVLQSLSFEQSDTAGVGGLCHGLGTKILMSNGVLKNVEDIAVGEYVLGIDSKPKKVLKTFKGQSELLNVEQKRGNPYVVTPDHTLYLKTRDVRVKEKDRNMKAKEWLNLSLHQKTVVVGYKNSNVLTFANSKEVSLSPYFLGLWIGDGYRNTVGFIVNKDADPEILKYIEEYGKSRGAIVSVRRKEQSRYNVEMNTITVHTRNKHNEDNEILKDFVKYNLFFNKHIPEDYLTSSPENRAELLAGIIDTDGHYCSRRGHFEISTKYEKLSKDVAFLCRSLGAYVRTNKKTSKEQGNIRESTSYCVSARFLDSSIIPTKVKRKVGTHVRSKNIFSSPIKSITSLGVNDYAGIHVKDELYFLEDLTITHNCTLFFYEEAGIAKSMDNTYEFMRPAMESGDITTGYFVGAGSVGDLKQCEPLKKFMQSPKGNGFYGVKNKWINDKGSVAITGLFIPEQWSMPPFIDEFGNSKVEEALVSIFAKRIQWKKDLDPEQYQIRISQHPTNLEEAFAFRGESIFPTQLVKSNKRDIEEGDYPYKSYKLEYNNLGEVIATLTNKPPIKDFPIQKSAEDKTGVIQVWEEPDEEKDFCTTYFASVDPVGEGKTVTSESLCSIYIYKNPVQVQRVLMNGEVQTHVEGDKIVACWCGRFDDINKTHERLELMIEWYQAWTIVENNVPLFIQHMQFKRKQKYLVPSSQMVLSKEVQASKTQFQQYGWRNVSTLFKTVMLSYLIEYLKEELDQETDTDGKVYKTYYGISRIPDIMAMVEMEEYQPGLNVDRLISLGALITFVKIQESNRGLKKRVEYEDSEYLENSENLYKLNRSPFKNIGKGNTSLGMTRQRNAFKNFR